MVVAIILAILISCSVIGALVGYLVYWSWGNRPTFKTRQGVSLFVDDSIKRKIDLGQFEKYFDAFIENMSPVPFNRSALKTHMMEMVVRLRDRSLSTTAPNAANPKKRIEGLTHSMTEVEIACDEPTWVGARVWPHRTALGYELLNACIEALATNGYYVALAEGFIDPEKKTFWGWFMDVNKDNTVNESDLEIFKKSREFYDKEWRRAQGSIDACMEDT